MICAGRKVTKGQNDKGYFVHNYTLILLNNEWKVVALSVIDFIIISPIIISHN